MIDKAQKFSCFLKIPTPGASSIIYTAVAEAANESRESRDHLNLRLF